MLILKNSIDYFLIPSLSALSFILCFVSIIIFKDKKLNDRLYKYLKVKSIYESFLSLITMLRFIHICKDIGCEISNTYFAQIYFVYIYCYLGFVFDALTNFMDILITIERYYTLKHKKESTFYRLVINPTMLIIVNIFFFIYFLPYPIQVQIVSIDQSTVDVAHKNLTIISKSYVLNDDRFNLNLVGYLLLMLIFFLKLIFFTVTTIFSGFILFKLSKRKLSVRYEFNQKRAGNFYLKAVNSESNSTISDLASNKPVKLSNLQKIIVAETKITFMILFIIVNCVLRNLVQTVAMSTPFMNFLSPIFLKLIDSISALIHSILRLVEILLYYIFNIHYRELFQKKIHALKCNSTLS